MMYDVYQNCKIWRNVTEKEAWKIVGQSWSPYTVKFHGTQTVAREFIPF